MDPLVWLSTNFGYRWTRSKLVQLAKSRWLVIVAAIWIQSSVGGTYNFSIYSQTIKDSFNYDQKHLGTLATWKDLGANIGILSGLVFDLFSPKLVLAIGVIQSALAYFLLWLSVTEVITWRPFWVMCLYMFLAANGQSYFNTACVATCIKFFPRNRGVVIGLMKGFIGLSGAITTQLYNAIFWNSEPSSYLLIAGGLPFVITFLVGWFIQPVPAREEQHESTYLNMLSAIAVWLAASLTEIIVLENTMTISHDVYVALCVIIGVILLLPLGIVALTEEALPSSPSLRQPLVTNDAQIEPSSQSGPVIVPTDGNHTEAERVRDEVPESPPESQETGSTPSSPLRVIFWKIPCRIPLRTGNYRRSHLQLPEKRLGDDHTVREATKKFEFWLLCMAVACGMGGGLTAIDNTGQIAASLGYKPEVVGTLVSVFSICSFFGRLGLGSLSEWCLHNKNIGRPVLLACSQAFMAVGYVMVSSAIPSSLYPALTVIGLCYGTQWSLMPAITSDLFGLTRFATLFNTISIASPIGAYFLSVQVLGRLYDAEAGKDPNDWNTEDVQECYGAHCFRWTFIILAAVSVFGCTVCGLLAHRTKLFYARFLQNTDLR